MKVITVANTAGGVGKTTTAHAIAVAAVEYGKKVLLIDADPGAGLTFSCGIENPRMSTLEYLLNQFSLESAILKTTERFNFLPSATRLTSLDIDQAMSSDRFRESMKEFDVVIIDTATGPNRVSTYFLGLADMILIPTTMEILSVRGALHTKDFAQTSGQSAIPYLLIINEDALNEGEILSSLKASFTVLEPAIRKDTLVSVSQQQGSSVLTLHNQSGVAADYREVTYSLLEALELI